MPEIAMTRHRVARIATCNLNQWAMDFAGNLERIKSSIEKAKAAGATYRVGPELEIPGYGCEDHFAESDTIDHSWEALADLIASGLTQGIVCDIGMPVIHRGVRYNCRAFVLDGRVLLLRPKMHMADDGNYRESRHFTAWKKSGAVEEHRMPVLIAELTSQRTCPFGDAALQFNDTVLAAETCEELFTPMAPHIRLALSGVEIITNGSGSHHELRKLDTRLELMRSATAKSGGVYVYANQRGCDGGRLYFDGCACVVTNGKLVAQALQFGLQDVEVVTAAVDLDSVVSFRASISSLQEQASSVEPVPTVAVDFSLCEHVVVGSIGGPTTVSLPITPNRHCPEEEIAHGPAAWLWDYLRRSGASGFLLPLSGGADSSSTAAIVASMCAMVITAISEGDAQVLQDVRRVGQYDAEEEVTDAKELAGRIFATVYMGTVNSSGETRARAKQLACEIGSYHTDLNMDPVVSAMVALFFTVTGKTPRFKSSGGTSAENLALQNIQARLRMVVAFLLAQLLPWVRGRQGFLLVLGSANVDELLRGYLTKYDCSSADINPIGGISKGDLRAFLQWGAVHLGLPSLAAVEAAPPTAELEPLVEGQKPQNDEDDMGISYEDLGIFGRMRKVSRYGPVSMFTAGLRLWQGRYSVQQIADKVKFFYRMYAMNRHKATTITPSYHAENYSPDDNRFDQRQFLYNTRWPWQFQRIDQAVSNLTAAQGTAAAPQ